MINDIILAKIAQDAGFAVEHGKSDGWLHFSVPGRQIRAAISGQGDAIAVGLSRAEVIGEISLGEIWTGSLPTEIAAAKVCASEGDVAALLRRAWTLDRTLPGELLHQYQKATQQIETTEAIATVKQRRGQDIFRKGLLEYWEGRCAITGVELEPLLRASHAKPWKDATDEERLDVHNGLLLAAHLDVAFDQGYFTVTEKNAIKLSPLLTEAVITILGIRDLQVIEGLNEPHQIYLAWHRKYVFKNIDD